MSKDSGICEKAIALVNDILGVQTSVVSTNEKTIVVLRADDGTFYWVFPREEVIARMEQIVEYGPPQEAFERQHRPAYTLEFLEGDFTLDGKRLQWTNDPFEVDVSRLKVLYIDDTRFVLFFTDKSDLYWDYACFTVSVENGTITNHHPYQNKEKKGTFFRYFSYNKDVDCVWLDKVGRLRVFQRESTVGGTISEEPVISYRFNAIVWPAGETRQSLLATSAYRVWLPGAFGYRDEPGTFTVCKDIEREFSNNASGCGEDSDDYDFWEN